MKYYVTFQSPRYHQMTLEEFWYGGGGSTLVTNNENNTRVYAVEQIPQMVAGSVSRRALVSVLRDFVNAHRKLIDADLSTHYHSYKILKRSGGFRPIDEPLPALKAAQYELKDILSVAFRADTIYHTAAFAYVKHRSPVDATKRHQSNESWWFAHLDFRNFFGSVTYEYTMRILSDIFPFCQVVEDPEGAALLRDAMKLCFLNGVLPQGSPLSPMLTNIIMVPMDYVLASRLRDLDGKRFVYTRYADDMQFSCRVDFNVHMLEQLVEQVVREFDAPFQLRPDKTSYGSRSGSNWMLGTLLNKDNKISIGYKNVRTFKNTLYNFIRDQQNQVPWETGDIYHALGLYSWYRSVDPDGIDAIVQQYHQKYGINAIAAMQAVIAGRQ